MRSNWKWLVLAALAIAGGVAYRATMKPPAAPTAHARLSPAILAPLQRDEALLQTADTLSTLANTPDEAALAAQARHLADEMVDLSFTIALNQAGAAAPVQATPAVQEAEARVRRVKADVADDQRQWARIKAAAAPPPGALDEIQAQLELDQARLQDATADAARAGSGVADAIEQLRREHEALHAASAPVSTAAAGAMGLVGELTRTWSLTSELHQLVAAEAVTRAAIPSILAEHNQLDAAFSAARAAVQAEPAGPGRAPKLRALAAQQQQVSRFDLQDDTASALADTYRQWEPLVAAQRQAIAHGALGRSLGLLAVLAALLLLLRAVTRALRRPHLDRHRATTLLHMARLVVEVAALLAALVILFGQPPRLLTIFGLAGAGLTLAFQDTLMSFAGWFVLVGRGGLRLGDWVEIGGVVGEVMDIRLLKTELLETGNWITAGHPTGRRVFFPNSFALKGSYFNYCAAGQWMWDEIQAPLPATLDAHAVLTRISELLKTELASHSRPAPSELHNPEPTAQLRPSGDSFVLVVRYPTPASQRAALRERVWALIAGSLALPKAALAP